MELKSNSRLRWVCLICAASVAALAILYWESAWVWYQVRLARTEIDGDRAEAAIKLLDHAIESSPDSAELEFWAARACRHAGRFEDVSEHLAKARSLGMDEKVLQREQWLTLAHSGRLFEVEHHLPKLLEVADESTAEVCHAFSIGYLLNLRVSSALELIEAWQKDFPDDARPHFMRAYAFELLNRSQDAVAALREGLLIASDRPKEHQRLGQLLLELNDYDEAEQSFRTALGMKAGDHEASLGVARCQFHLGEVEEARTTAESIIAVDSENVETLIFLGEVELELGNFEAANVKLEDAFQHEPRNATVRYLLAQTLRGLGRPEEAVEHAQFAAEAEKQLAIADDKMQQALTSPKDAELRYDVGRILLEYANPDDGVRWLHAALQIDPKNRDAHQLLAHHFKQQDMQTLAEIHQQAIDASREDDQRK